jgi:hypothetical protein
MLTLIRLCLSTVARLFCARRRLLLENLALRQQLVVFKRRRPRPRLNILDKLCWVTAHRIWQTFQVSTWITFIFLIPTNCDFAEMMNARSGKFRLKNSSDF